MKQRGREGEKSSWRREEEGACRMGRGKEVGDRLGRHHMGEVVPHICNIKVEQGGERTRRRAENKEERGGQGQTEGEDSNRTISFCKIRLRGGGVYEDTGGS